MPPKRLMFAASLCALFFLAACGGGGAGESSNMSEGSTPVVQSAPRTVYPMPPPTTKAATESGRTPHGWTLLDNSRQKLANYAGQVVVLDFYATWCQPCREEVPHLVRLQKQYAARGLRVIGLNVGGADDRAQVPGFVKEFGIPYQLGYPDEQMVDLYLSDDDRIPQTYVFDRNGTLVKRFVSYGADMPAELERTVQTALAGDGKQQAAIKRADDSTKAVVAVSH